jgi:hypothetical protein
MSGEGPFMIMIQIPLFFPLFSLYVCNIPIDTRVYAHCDLMVNHPPLFLFLPPFSDSHMFDYMNST